MKTVWVVIILMCCVVSPAYSYIEDKDTSGTQLTAGEQNSNLYRLNSKGASALKILKKADEYIARNESRGNTVQASDLEDLLLSDEEDKQKQQLKIIMEKVKRQTANPQKLRVASNPETFSILQNMQKLAQKDKAKAVELKSKIIRRPL